MPKPEQKNETESETEQLKEWTNYVCSLSRLGRNGYVEPYNISIVPESLKKGNEDEYMPRVVSIGPRHRGTKEALRHMEETRLRCMFSLLHRGTTNALTFFENCIEIFSELEFEKNVRQSYTGDIKVNKVEFVKIMLVDGCFLLELLMEFDGKYKSRLYPPGPAAEVLKDEQVLSDLTLLENQIPVLILHKLYQTIFHEFNDEDRVTKLNKLVLSLFRYPPSQVPSPLASHFLAVTYSSVHKREEFRATTTHQTLPSTQLAVEQSFCVNSNRVLKLKRCAARLQAAGVTILLKPSNRDSNDEKLIKRFFSLHVKNNVTAAETDVKIHDMEITFSNGKLEIPQLHITKTTKSKWLNCIAWEHHVKYWNRNNTTPGPDSIPEPAFGRFTSAALILDGLICCPADVRLLKSKRIIVDHLEMDNEDFKAFFSSILKGVDQDVMDCRYVEMLDDLNKHFTSICMVRILLTLWHCFVCHVERLFKFMRKDYNFAVTVVPLFTIAQTVYTALQYYHPDNPPPGHGQPPPPPQRQ